MNNLKKLRKMTNTSQRDIAKILNMSQNGYSQYETGTHDIPTEILRILSDYYDTSVDYILGIVTLKNNYKKSIIKNDKNLKVLNRLKEIREDRDLYQKDISEIINIGQTGYSKYEVGTNDIPTKVLIKLAYYYDVSVDYLLYMTDDRKSHPKIKEI